MLMVLALLAFMLIEWPVRDPRIDTARPDSKNPLLAKAADLHHA